MNIVAISGRLTADPIVRYTQEGKAIANYTLAINYSRETSAFIACTAYDEKAAFVEKYLKKGSSIEVEGRLRSGSYTGRDGKKVYYTEVVVNNQSFRESKAAAEAREQFEALQEQQEDDFTNIPEGMDVPFA